MYKKMRKVWPVITFISKSLYEYVQIEWLFYWVTNGQFNCFTCFSESYGNSWTGYFVSFIPGMQEENIKVIAWEAITYRADSRLRPANKRLRYKVTPSLIGLEQA